QPALTGTVGVGQPARPDEGPVRCTSDPAGDAGSGTGSAGRASGGLAAPGLLVRGASLGVRLLHAPILPHPADSRAQAYGTIWVWPRHRLRLSVPLVSMPPVPRLRRPRGLPCSRQSTRRS